MFAVSGPNIMPNDSKVIIWSFLFLSEIIKTFDSPLYRVIQRNNRFVAKISFCSFTAVIMVSSCYGYSKRRERHINVIDRPQNSDYQLKQHGQVIYQEIW